MVKGEKNGARKIGNRKKDVGLNLLQGRGPVLGHPPPPHTHTLMATQLTDKHIPALTLVIFHLPVYGAAAGRAAGLTEQAWAQPSGISREWRRQACGQSQRSGVVGSAWEHGAP